MKKVLATSLILVLVVVCVGIVFSDSINFDFNVKAENTSADTQSFLQFEQDLMDMNSDLSMDTSDDIADDNNEMKNSYSVSDDGEVENDFSLKRLIVTGTVKNTYGAQKVASYDDLHILSYATVEETKIAYKKLSADKSLIVSVDSVVEAEQYAEKEYDYSDYVNWGAEAMDIGGYRQYLLDNKSAETDREVVVVVIDTGINTSHPMFEGRLLTDENGKIRGYSYYNSTYKYSYNNLAFDIDDPVTTDIDEGDTTKYSFEDDHSHGTHVAGIIAGLTPSNVKILPIKIAGSSGTSTLAVMIAAHLRVINIYSKQYEVVSTNLSFSGGGKNSTSERDNFNKQCYNPLMELGISPVTSAGNDGTKNSIGGLNAIVVSNVASVGDQYVHFGTTTYGSIVDIAAPGTMIFSAGIASTDGPSDAFAFKTGTSMASPQVAAAVALLRLDPSHSGYTATDIENKLYEHTVDMGASGKDIYYGHGMVNFKYFEVSNTAAINLYENGSLVNSREDYKKFKDTIFNIEAICSDPEFKIVYTTDGSIPTCNSKEYNDAICVEKTTILRFMGFKIADGQIVEKTPLYNLPYFNTDTPLEECFIVNDAGYIEGYLGDMKGIKDVVVPDTVRGITIVGLQRGVFSNSIAESITIPEAVVDIDYPDVFFNCANLYEVNAVGAVSIDNQKLFATCPNLTSLSLGLTTIDKTTFEKLTNLTSLYLPKLTAVPANAFDMLTKLTGEFFIGKDLHTIEPYSFGLTKVTSFAIHPNNKTFYTDGIGVYTSSEMVAFAVGNTGLNYEIKSEVEIDGIKSTITTVGETAMRGCNLNSLTIPETLTLLKGRAFTLSSINTIYYNAISAEYDFISETGKLPPLFSTVGDFVFGENVKHVHPYLLAATAMAISNVIVNSRETYFDDTSLRFSAGVSNIIFNFEEPIDAEYLAMLDKALMFYSSSTMPGLTGCIMSKSEFPIADSPFASKFTSVTTYGDYYVYRSKSFDNTYVVDATYEYGGYVTNAGITFYNAGESPVYNIIEGVGYDVEYILVDGQVLSDEETEKAITNGYKFNNISENHTLHVAFVNNTQFTVDVTPGDHGSIRRISGSYAIGDSATFEITPDAGYHIKHLIIDGEIVEASSEYTFENISANHTISAVFEANTDTAYKVRHWQQVLSAEGAVAVDGKYYILVETDMLAGTTDTETNVVANDYVGFTALAFNQANIAGNGNAVIDIYYDRNEYSVFLNFGDELISATGDGVYLYGETVKIDAELQEDYKWIQWLSADESLVANSIEMDFIFTMPAGEVTFTAIAEYVEYPYIAVKTLSLEREMTMVFYVDADALAGKENISLAVKKPVYADGNGEVIREEVDVVTEYTSAKVLGKNMFRFVYGNLNAKEYGIEVTATLIADGRVKDVDTFSVREYAYGQLSKTTNVKFRTLLVDLLNYGAASQVYFNYNTNDLVNAGLTEEQKAYATPEMPEVSSKAEKIEGADGLVKVQGSSIALMKTIDSRIVFDVGCDVNDVFAIIYCYSISGNDKVMIVDGSQFEKVSGGDNRYQYVFSEYGATQMRDTFTIKFYRKSSGERIGDTYTYSIESYIAVALEKTTNVKFIALMDMMMKYGASAEAYFG